MQRLTQSFGHKTRSVQNEVCSNKMRQSLL